MKWITYQTRKQLKEEISNLKSQLQRELERTAIIDLEDLPPCKSWACINCKHIVYYRMESGTIFILGCGKDHGCPDFEQNADVLTEREIVESVEWKEEPRWQQHSL